MKITDITQEIDNFNDVFKITDLEHFFTVHEDNGKYKYNLNETLYIDAPDAECSHYVLKHDLFWTTISYNIYGTTRLAWLLMKLNNVKAKDMFAIVRAGQSVKYIKKDTVQSVIDTIY